MDLKDIKEKLALACRIIEAEGITDRGKGHQCVLLPENKILLPGHLHDKGRSLIDVTPDDLVIIDFEGNVLDGNYKEPMGEFFIYSSIFRIRNDVKSIIHYHPFYANVLAIANQEILPISQDGCFFKEGVPIYENFPLYIGTKEMADEIAQMLGKKRAIRHRGHGVVVVGKSIEDTLVFAINLEKAAKYQFFASTLGPIKPFPKDWVKSFRTELSDHNFAGNFDYFANKLKKSHIR